MKDAVIADPLLRQGPVPSAGKPRCSSAAPVMVRSSVLPKLVDLLRSLRVDPQAIMREAGVDPRMLDNPDQMLPMRNLVRMIERSAGSSGLEDFGLRLAKVRGLPDFGPVMLILREQLTLRDSLLVLRSFLQRSGGLDFDVRGLEVPVMALNIFADEEANRQSIVALAGGLVTLLRWLLGESWSPAAVMMTQARPFRTAEYEQFFRCFVDFQQDCCAIVLNHGDLERRLSSSGVLRRYAKQYLQFVDTDETANFTQRVRHAVARALQGPGMCADAIARRLGMTRRTLHRHLAADGGNFSKVVNDVRREMAKHYLLGSRRSLSDIAGLVGFTSLSTFSRWFKHAFDDSPQAWRAANAHPAHQGDEIGAPTSPGR